MKSINKKLEVNGDILEFNVDPKNAIIVQRHFKRLTERDEIIEKEPLPVRPFWLWFTIKSIRFYQKYISEKLGNRCVYDPSCSHYSELAFRKYGFIKGIKLTISRLKRCQPINGGIDELT